MNRLIILLIACVILTSISLTPVYSRNLPSLYFTMDDKYIRGERVDFIVMQGTTETFPFQVTSTTNIPITVEFDSTIQVGIGIPSSLPNGILSNFYPSKITLQPGETADVNLVISIDDLANTTIYNNLYLLGTWKEEGKIPESTSTSIRLHVGKDFGIMGSDPDVVFPPLKQVKAGVPIQDIQCKEELFLLYKAKTLSPACVFGDSKGELLLRGWGLLRIVNPGEIITQELLCKATGLTGIK